MDEHAIHLIVNHIPIIGTAIGLLVTLAGAVLVRDDVRKAGLIIYIVTGLFIFLANFTGEATEHIVEEKYAWVSHDQIHEHEEAAETAMTLTSIGLVLALLHLFNWPPTPGFRRLLLSAFMVVAIAGTAMAIYTGFQGGKILRVEEFKS